MHEVTMLPSSFLLLSFGIYSRSQAAIRIPRLGLCRQTCAFRMRGCVLHACIAIPLLHIRLPLLFPIFAWHVWIYKVKALVIMEIHPNML